MNRSSLRIGIIGAGRMGRAHQRAVVAVQDIRPETAQQVAMETDAEIATDELDVFFDCDLDGVIITTPPPVRREPVQRACERGIPWMIDFRSSRGCRCWFSTSICPHL